jgi:transposase
MTRPSVKKLRREKKARKKALKRARYVEAERRRYAVYIQNCEERRAYWQRRAYWIPGKETGKTNWKEEGF